MKTKIIYLGVIVVLGVTVFLSLRIFSENNINQSLAEKSSITWEECEQTPVRIKIKSLNGVSGLLQFDLICRKGMFESFGDFNVILKANGSVGQNHSGYQLYVHTKQGKTATEIIGNLLRQHNKDERCEIRNLDLSDGNKIYYVKSDYDNLDERYHFTPTVDCELFGKPSEYSGEQFFDLGDIVLIIRSDSYGGAYSFDVKSVRFIPE